MDRIRILRILEYEGNRNWVEETLQRRIVRGEHHVSSARAGPGIIREAILGEFSTLIQGERKEVKSRTFRFETEGGGVGFTRFRSEDPNSPILSLSVAYSNDLSQAAELDITIKPA